MKKLTTAAFAALALAATIPASVLAADPVNPVPGALCNLYPSQNQSGSYESIAEALSQKPSAATFIDTASDFKASGRKQGIDTVWGVWTGWMKIDRAGTYTFIADGGDYYSIRINGKECASGNGQEVFNVELNIGFNSVVIYKKYNKLTITYRRAGSLKEPVAFGPKDMFYDKDAVEED